MNQTRALFCHMLLMQWNKDNQFKSNICLESKNINKSSIYVFKKSGFCIIITDWNLSNPVRTYIFVCVIVDELQIRVWFVFTWRQRRRQHSYYPHGSCTELCSCSLSLHLLSPWQWTHFLQPVYSASVVLQHRVEPVAYRDNSLDLNHKRSPALWHSFSRQGRVAH